MAWLKGTILICVVFTTLFSRGYSAVCSPPIEFAVECSGTTVTKCVNNFDGIKYYPYDSTGGTTITPTKCDVCVKETLALTTRADSSTACALCSAKMADCSVCRGYDSKCFKCNSGKFLVDENKDGVFEKCTDCLDTSGYFSYLASSDGYAVCEPCSNKIPYCKKCAAQGATCTECETGYFFNTDKTQCWKCNEPVMYINTNSKCDYCFNGLPNCEECRGQTETCFKCLYNYFLLKLNGNQVCDPCPLESKSYFRAGLSNGKGVCAKCSDKIANCAECIHEGLSCTKCNTNYFLFSSKGDSINDVCRLESDLSGGTLTIVKNSIAGDGIIAPCDVVIAGCHTCNLVETNYICSECKPGLFRISLDDGEVNYNKCMESCDNLEGFYYDNNIKACRRCATVISGCKSCRGVPISCDRCEENSFRTSLLNNEVYDFCTPCTETSSYKFIEVKDGTGVCKKCNTAMPNVNECTKEDRSSVVKIISCESGYFPLYLNGNWPEKCDKCNSFDKTKVFSDFSKTCIYCSNRMRNCETCDANTCLKCKPGYFLTPYSWGNLKQRIYLDCTKDCFNEYSNIIRGALHPEDPYRKDGSGKCVGTRDFIANCASIIGGTCVKCEEKYYLYSSRSDGIMDKCVFCNLPSQYAEDRSVINGSGVCQKCSIAIPGCVECREGKTCSACQPGSFLDKKSESSAGFDVCVGCAEKTKVRADPADLSGKGQCKTCKDFIQNCEVCYGSSSSCNQCKSGFYLYSTNKNYIYDTCVACNLTSQLVVNSTDGSFGICDTCESHFPGCSECNSTQCLTCKAGLHFLMPWKISCVPCDNPKTQYITVSGTDQSTCSFYPYQASFKVSQNKLDKVADLEFSCTDPGKVYFAIGLQSHPSWDILSYDKIKVAAISNMDLKTPLSLKKENDIVYGSVSLSDDHQIVKAQINDVNFDRTYIIVKYCENDQELAGPRQINYISLEVTGEPHGPKFSNIDIVKVWVPVVLIIVFVLMIFLIIWAKKLNRIEEALG